MNELHHPDARVRERTAFNLGNAGDHDAAEALAALLTSDPAASVREAAAWSLGAVGDPRGAEALCRALRDGSEAVAGAAGEALQKLLPQVEGDVADGSLVNLLTEALDDRAAATAARTAAIHALGRLQGGAATGRLIQTLHDTDETIAVASVWALARIEGVGTEVLAQALRGYAPRVRKAAAKALASRKDKDAIGPLLEALADDSSGGDGARNARAAVRQAIVAIDPHWEACHSAQSAVPGLTDGLRRGSRASNWTDVLWALEGLRTTEALAPLIAAMKPMASRDGGAVRVLRASSDRSCIATLVEGFVGSPDWLQQDICSALQDIDSEWSRSEGARESLASLIRALDSSSQKDRQSALRMVEWIEPDVRALPALLGALAHSDAAVRIAIARSLGKLGSPEACSRLVELLIDSNPTVRAVGREVLEILDSRWVSRSDTQNAVPALISGLSADSPQVVIAALEVLGQVHSPSALTDIVLKLIDPAPDVQQAALMAADSVDPSWPTSAATRRRVPAFMEALNDVRTNVRIGAVRALPSLSHRGAVPGLLRLLVDQDEDVRAIALNALRVIDAEWPTSPEASDTVPLLVDTLGAPSSKVRVLALTLFRNPPD